MSDTAHDPWLAAVLALLGEVNGGDPDVRFDIDSPSEAQAKLCSALNELLSRLQKERRRRAQMSCELEEAHTAVELLRAAKREISAPIIEVWRGVLCVPLVGVLDEQRRAEADAALFARVAEKSVSCVIVDVTGLSAFDEVEAAWLVRISRTLELLGARCVLTGISAEIAETFLHIDIDIDIGRLITVGSVRDALARYTQGRL